MGRRRLKWRMVACAVLFAAGMVYATFTGPEADSTSRSLRAVPGAAAPGPSLLHGRRLSSNHSCPAEPAVAELSVISAIVGPGLCDGRDTCTYCCTGFDMTVGVPVYFLIMLYMFLGLAIICDDYFCESLDAISEALSLSEDVAGATFMAAGSSAPELFTAIVTVLITNGSEGLGTIVGSAIFNIMIIVGVTAIFAGQILKVWWYPLTRDCIVYFLSIVGMVWAIEDKAVQWWEALVLVLCYGGYIALMVFNEGIVKRVKKCERACKNRGKKTKKPQPGPVELTKATAKHRPDSPITNEKIAAAAARLARASLEESSLTEAAKAAVRASMGAERKASPGTPEAWNSPGAKPDADTASAVPKHVAKDTPADRRSPKVGPSPTPSPAPRALLDPLRTESNLSVSQVAAAIPDESKAGSGSVASSPAPASPGLAALAGSFGSKSSAKYAVPKPKKAKAPEEEKKASNPLLKAENRRVWGGDSKAKRRREQKRAAKQVRVTMKVAVAASRFRKGLLRARSRQGSPAGSPAGSPRKGLASSAGSSKLLAAMSRMADPEVAAKKKAEEEKKKKEEEDDDDDSCFDKFLNIIGWPLAMAMKYTCPPCAEDEWKKWYMLTFTMSILWIGLLSYVMVDMAGRAGCVLGIPGLVMGLVVLAAGTSVPDALSSILVAKLGQGDMAVANVLGSNVFNILLGLGLPWFARALMDGHAVMLPEDEEIVQPVIVLLLYLAFFITVIALCGWKLSKLLGGIFIAAHFVFLAWNLLTLLPDPLIKL